MYRSISIAAVFAVWVGAAHADSFTDSIVSNLKSLGYEFIEIQNGLDQVKVEAIRGADKLEVIYDRATGQILKQEMARAGADDMGRTGVEIQVRDRNFLDDDETDDDNGGSGSGSDDGNDDDSSGSGSDDDDGGDDHGGSGSSNSGSGSDDHESDD